MGMTLPAKDSVRCTACSGLVLTEPKTGEEKEMVASKEQRCCCHGSIMAEPAGGRKKKKTKWVVCELSQCLVDQVLNNPPPEPCIDPVVNKMQEWVAAEIEDSREFHYRVLKQHELFGYVEVLAQVTDDEEEE